MNNSLNFEEPQMSCRLCHFSHGLGETYWEKLFFCANFLGGTEYLFLLAVGFFKDWIDVSILLVEPSVVHCSSSLVKAYSRASERNVNNFARPSNIFFLLTEIYWNLDDVIETILKSVIQGFLRSLQYFSNIYEPLEIACSCNYSCRGTS
jgi:hypothetical protein